jgi:hypothetical protein
MFEAAVSGFQIQLLCRCFDIFWQLFVDVLRFFGHFFADVLRFFGHFSPKVGRNFIQFSGHTVTPLSCKKLTQNTFFSFSLYQYQWQDSNPWS